MCRHDTTSLPGNTDAPRLARGFASAAATATIGAQHVVIANVGLVCSELVTNAVQAGSPEVIIDVDVHRCRVDIAVTDTAAGMPRARDPLPTEERGRGLRIVAALAHRVVIESRPGQKTVSAQLLFEPPIDPVDLACDRGS